MSSASGPLGFQAHGRGSWGRGGRAGPHCQHDSALVWARGQGGLLHPPSGAFCFPFCGLQQASLPLPCPLRSLLKRCPVPQLFSPPLCRLHWGPGDAAGGAPATAAPKVSSPTVPRPERLGNLIDLGRDSREARWLPSLPCTYCCGRPVGAKGGALPQALVRRVC